LVESNEPVPLARFSPPGWTEGRAIPDQNAEIAERLERYADLLAIEGANPFRVRAYRNAAMTIRSTSSRLSEMVAAGADLSQLHGVGRTIAAKITEVVQTGHLRALEGLERREGPELVDLLRIPGLGPKRVQVLHELLGVRTLDELAEAARTGRVSALSGFGPKTESAILAAIARGAPGRGRLLRAEAEPIAESLVEFLRELPGVERVVVAGSYRRRRETVGDLDLIVGCARGRSILERFVEYEDVSQVVSLGSTRASVVLRSGLEVDLRAVPSKSFGAALHYFTGSKAHVVAVRRLAIERGLKVNEYGVFRGDEPIAGEREEDVFESVGLSYIQPELREDRGEIEAAARDELPKLVELREIRGDLHVHTRASDGRGTIEAMVEGARARGYDYLAITDHSQALRVAHGLDRKRLREQLRGIDRANERNDDITLLKSSEVDILEDGSLDIADDLLDELDLCVGAVHSHLGLSARKQTERILRAMDHPRLQVLAHPTGRLIGSRDSYGIELERVIEGAAERGCWLELNAQPQRLDLDDVWVRTARDADVRISIASDAHAAPQLDFMRYGVAQARRGWIERRDVVNTLSLSRLRRAMRG
jgi:DNA polymerase (family 10)